MKEIKLDILAFGAHPDDIELGCGGTIAKEIHNGKKIGIIDLTRGELGTRGDAIIRDIEAKNASKILGVIVTSTCPTFNNLPISLYASVLEIRK